MNRPKPALRQVCQCPHCGESFIIGVRLTAKVEVQPEEPHRSYLVADLPDIPGRLRTALLDESILTIGDVMDLGIDGLKRLHNVGKASVNELVQTIEAKFDVEIPVHSGWRRLFAGGLAS